MNKQPDWINYWNSLIPQLDNFFHTHAIPEAEQYLTNSFAFLSYTTEDFPKKIQKNKEASGYLVSILLESLDLSRSLIHCQRLLLLAPSALIYRTQFEIYCNLLLITKSENPLKTAKAFDDFKMFERLLWESKNEDDLNPEKFKTILSNHPEWRKNNSDLVPHSKAHFTGKNGRTLFDFCKDLKLENEYEQIYRTTSKFVHASPVVTNLYSWPTQMSFISKPETLINLTLPAMEFSHKIIREICDFYGVTFSEYDWALIAQDFIKVHNKYVGDV